MRTDRIVIFDCKTVHIEIDHASNCVTFTLAGDEKWTNMSIAVYGDESVPQFLDTTTIQPDEVEQETIAGQHEAPIVFKSYSDATQGE